jgi:hypothetical protein
MTRRGGNLSQRTRIANTSLRGRVVTLGRRLITRLETPKRFDVISNVTTNSSHVLPFVGRKFVIAASRFVFDDDQKVSSKRQETEEYFWQAFLVGSEKRSLEGGKTHQKEIFRRIWRSKAREESCVECSSSGKIPIKICKRL